MSINEQSEISDQQLSYRPLSSLAVMSLVFGGLSLLVVFDWSMVAVPIAGITLGILAICRIRATA